ncbi:MAG TPA: hypothetical protein VLL52_10250 [Anaerolineae bacterium]|nr:hypothetical protein [Anaerolineae bacterium]
MIQEVYQMREYNIFGRRQQPIDMREIWQLELAQWRFWERLAIDWWSNSCQKLVGEVKAEASNEQLWLAGRLEQIEAGSSKKVGELHTTPESLWRFAWERLRLLRAQERISKEVYQQAEQEILNALRGIMRA